MVFDKQHLSLFVALAFLFGYANAVPTANSDEKNVERLRGDLHQFIEMIISCLTNTKTMNHSNMDPSQLHNMKQITNSLQEDVGLPAEGSHEIGGQHLRKSGIGDALPADDETSSEGPVNEVESSSETNEEPNNFSKEDSAVYKDTSDGELNHDHSKENRREFDIQEGDSHGFTPRTTSIETTDSNSAERFVGMSTTSSSIQQDGDFGQSGSKEDIAGDPSINQQAAAGRKSIFSLFVQPTEQPEGTSAEHQEGISAEHSGKSAEHLGKSAEHLGKTAEHPGKTAEHPGKTSEFSGKTVAEHPGKTSEYSGKTSAEHIGKPFAESPRRASADNSGGASAEHSGGALSSKEEEISLSPNNSKAQSIEEKLKTQLGKIHKNLSEGLKQFKLKASGRKSIGDESTSNESKDKSDKSENNTEEIQVRNLIKEAPKFETGSSVNPYEALHIYGVQTDGPINKIVFEGGEHHPPRPLTIKESKHLKEFIRMVIKTNQMHSPMATFPVEDEEISSRSGFSENYTKKSPWADKPVPLELV